MAEMGKDFSPVDVLHLAIQREKDAHTFYVEMAARFAADPGAKAMFATMAEEELKHQRKLEAWLEEHFQREN